MAHSDQQRSDSTVNREHRFDSDDAEQWVGAIIFNRRQHCYGEVIGYGQYEGEVIEEGCFLLIDWKTLPMSRINRDALSATCTLVRRHGHRDSIKLARD